MKITCEQKDLTRALNTVSKAVPVKTTMEIMRCIKLEIEPDNKLYVTATNTDMRIIQEVPVTVYEPGCSVVAARLFSESIRKLNQGEILLEDYGEGFLTVKTDSSELRVRTFDEEEFPQMNNLGEYESKVELDGNSFAEMIAKTSFAASLEEARGVLTGVLIEMKNESLNMVALDGYRLAVVSEKMMNGEEKNVIVDAKLLSNIGKIIQEEEDTDKIIMCLENKYLSIDSGRTNITVVELEGEYMDYKKLLEHDAATTVIIDRKKLIESIERASLLAREEKNNLIKVVISDDVMNILSSSEEGAVFEEIIIEKDGEDLTIGFNAKYMTDILKVIDDDSIKMEMNSEIKPCLISQVSGDRYQYLVLPVRVPR